MIQRAIDNSDLDKLHISRQQLCTTWQDVVKVPTVAGGNYCLILPFCETFENAFNEMYDREFFANHANGGRLQIWLNDSGAETAVPAEAQAWIDTVGKYVAMKDYLALSFAIDFTSVGGNPASDRTEIAILRSAAKPYKGAATKEHHAAAAKLAEHCFEFLDNMSCYDDVDCVVAVPPSDPEKAYSLPRVLAAAISGKYSYPDLSESVATIKKRNGLKEIPLAQKLASLRGTIEVKQEVFDGRTVLLVDDLYQSGTTLNYCAQLLLEAGASFVVGLACEKTCRNDDNTAGG